VWMSPAGLPTFSKLALRNPNETMTAGTYQIDIAMSTSIIFCGN
jgi:LEM3 (ligand-effect modulator 3) family / CDC50 family